MWTWIEKFIELVAKWADDKCVLGAQRSHAFAEKVRFDTFHPHVPIVWIYAKLSYSWSWISSVESIISCGTRHSFLVSTPLHFVIASLESVPFVERCQWTNFKASVNRNDRFREVSCTTLSYKCLKVERNIDCPKEIKVCSAKDRMWKVSLSSRAAYPDVF